MMTVRRRIGRIFGWPAALCTVLLLLVGTASADATPSIDRGSTREQMGAAVAMGSAYDRAVQALIRGDETAAASYYQAAIREADRGRIRDVRYALSCVELALLRARAGDVDEAVSLMAEAHAARRAELGARHPDVVETRLMLRELERQQRARSGGEVARLAGR